MMLAVVSFVVSLKTIFSTVTTVVDDLQFFCQSGDATAAEDDKSSNANGCLKSAEKNLRSFKKWYLLALPVLSYLVNKTYALTTSV